MTSSPTNTLHDDPAVLRVVFVCTGNICRSPMAEVIFRDAVEQAGLADSVTVTSCGIGGWHIGQGADRRAVDELAASGYDGSKHKASQLSDSDKKADLLVALDKGHVEQLLQRGVHREKIRLLRSFDPASDKKADVEDPYYGPREGFTTVRHQIEAAMPGMIEWARTWVADTSDR